MLNPLRGEVWLADLEPVRGHEQAGRRPVLIVSDDLFNSSGAEMVIVVPFTKRRRGITYHVEVAPPEGGLRITSYAMCENIRSITLERLVETWGEVDSITLSEIERRIILLLSIKVTHFSDEDE